VSYSTWKISRHYLSEPYSFGTSVHGRKYAVADQHSLCINKWSNIVPPMLLDYISKYLQVIVQSKVDFDAIFAQPYIIGVKNSFDGKKHTELKFKASLTWTKHLFHKLNLSWQKTINNDGKLPEYWEEKLNDMKVHVAYLIWKLKIDKILW
jgi:hypothetical protein